MSGVSVSLWVFFLFATTLGWTVSLVVPAEHKLNPPKVAYFHGGSLYYFQVKDRFVGFHDSPRKPDELWHGKLTLVNSFKGDKEIITRLGYAGDGLPDRWRMSHGFFWWQVDHISHGSASNHEAELWRVPLEGLATKRDDAWYNCTLDPMIALRHRAVNDTYFDVIPDTSRSIHVLLAYRDEIRVWRGLWSWFDRDKLPDRKSIPKDWPKEMPNIKWTNDIPAKWDGVELLQPHDARPVLRVRTDMREGFFAYQNKTHYFFVTISGKLYACRKSGEKQHTKLLWNDADSPIRAIIHDSDSQKTFAFTSAVGGADKHGRNVWFELAPKLRPIAYDPKKIPEWKPSDPLPTMMEYAQIILWHVPPADWHIPSGKVTAEQCQQLWADLTSTEIVKAHRAVWGLMTGASDSVIFLKEHLHPVPVARQEQFDQLLSDLDSESFDRRQAATRELSRGGMAESVMRKALADSPSLELRRRLEAILTDLPDWPMKNPELLRAIRAVGVLQQIGTSDAKALLEKVAAGAPSARLTQKAKDAILSFKRLEE